MSGTSETERTGALPAMLGILVLVMTIAGSMFYWMEDLMAAMEAVPETYYWAFFGLWITASVAGLIFGGEDARALGGVGIGMMIFAAAFPLSFWLAEKTAPIMESMAPSWEPVTWLAFGVTLGVVLMAVGYAYPRIRTQEAEP